MENVQQKTEQARDHERAERFDAAREVYARLAEEDGEHRDDPAFWLRLAALEARGGAADDAVGHYTRAIDLFQEAGQRNNAIALCHRVLALVPDHSATHLRLSELAAALGYGRDSRSAYDAYARLSGDAAAPPAPAVAARDDRDEPDPRDGSEDGGGADLPTLGGLDDFAEDGDDEADDELLPGFETGSLDDALPTLTHTPDTGADLGLEPTSLDEPAAAEAARFAPLEGLETTHGADEWDAPPPRDEPEGLPLVGLAPDDDGDEPVEDALPGFDAPSPEPALEAEPRFDDAAADDEEPAADLPLLAGAPDEEEPGAGAPAESSDDGDYVDLGALIFSDDEEEPSTRVPPSPPAPGEDPDFEEVLALFREKIDREIDEGDATSHYDLGLAFKEMGLLDDAVAQLQAALRGGANPLATLEVLGECFVEKGDQAVAEQVLTRATRLQGAREADLLGVHYWLGRCREAAGRGADARADYERVAALDPDFRDAAERLDRLRDAPDSL